jgi:hypothetical protein
MGNGSHDCIYIMGYVTTTRTQSFHSLSSLVLLAMVPATPTILICGPLLYFSFLSLTSYR